MQRIRILSAAIAAMLAMCVATAAADPSVKQMQLAEKQVLAFIAAQQVMRGILRAGQPAAGRSGPARGERQEARVQKLQGIR